MRLFWTQCIMEMDGCGMKDIEEVILKAIEKQLPILGICFGHQFLAHLFGGKVDYLWDTTKKRGIRKVQTLENNLLIEPQDDQKVILGFDQ